MDQLYFGGTIVTVGRRSGSENSEAMLVRDDKIRAVGSIAEVSAAANGDVAWLDLAGRAIVPGFNDSHTHLIEAGEQLADLALAGLSAHEIVDRIDDVAAALPEGAPLVCHRLDYASVVDPALRALDRRHPLRPMVVFDKTGHVAWVNTHVRRLLGLSKGDDERSGSYHLVVDSAGEPTGVLEDPYDCPAIRSFLASRTCEAEHAHRALEASVSAYHAAGITSTQDNTWYPRAYSILQREVTGLSVTCWPYGMDERSLPEMLRRRTVEGNFRVGPVKFLLDGALGSRTAWLWEPYRGVPETCGTGVPAMEIVRRVERHVASGRQLAFHAIGDRAVSELCDALELLECRYPWVPDLRVRIEHAQLVREQDFPRLKRLGIVVSAQPMAAGDFMTDLQLLGEKRAMRAYPHRSLLEHGIPLAFGSDFPFESSFLPVDGMIALSRRPSPERIDPVDMLRAYTGGSAYAEFSEERKGALEEGMDAEFAVLSQNPLHLGAHRDEPRVEMTVHAGETVYRSSSFQPAPRHSAFVERGRW